MRISDWSSDVCSSDLEAAKRRRDRAHRIAGDVAGIAVRALAQPELVKGNAVEVVAIAAEGMEIAAADPPPVHEFHPQLEGAARRPEKLVFLAVEHEGAIEGIGRAS